MPKKRVLDKTEQALEIIRRAVHELDELGVRVYAEHPSSLGVFLEITYPASNYVVIEQARPSDDSKIEEA